MKLRKICVENFLNTFKPSKMVLLFQTSQNRWECKYVSKFLIRMFKKTSKYAGFKLVSYGLVN